MCSNARASSPAAAKLNGVRVVCKPARSKTWRLGSRSIDVTGNKASTVSILICVNCKPKKHPLNRIQSRTRNLMSARKNNPSDSSDREIVITRVIDAPRELVFAAFTDAEHISNWWGPNGFRTTTYEKDVRPGGVWRFTMHGPDGTDYP